MTLHAQVKARRVPLHLQVAEQMRDPVQLNRDGSKCDEKDGLMPATDHAISHALSVRAITSLPDFEALGQEWDALVDGSHSQSFFLRHFWNFSWWQFYAPPASQLWILCCRDHDGRLLGVAPLYLRRSSILGIPCVRELLFLGMGIDLKTSEFLDIIARAGHEHQVAEALAAHLHASRQWDRIHLSQTPADSTFIPHFVESFKDRSTLADGDRAPCIDTALGWEHYKSTLGKSMRRNVEYYARRLFKKYPCEFRRVETDEELMIAMGTMARLHQARWHSSGSTGAFGHPSLVAFLLQVSGRHLSEGRVRMWVLTISGNIEATLLGFVDKGVLHYFQKGFNPAFAKDDLGTALLSLCIRDCCEDDSIQLFDFMGGGATYKDMWARKHRMLRSYHIAKPNVRSHLHCMANCLTAHCVRVLRALTPLPIRKIRRNMLINRRIAEQARQNTQQRKISAALFFLLIDSLTEAFNFASSFAIFAS